LDLISSSFFSFLCGIIFQVIFPIRLKKAKICLKQITIKEIIEITILEIMEEVEFENPRKALFRV